MEEKKFFRRMVKINRFLKTKDISLKLGVASAVATLTKEEFALFLKVVEGVDVRTFLIALVLYYSGATLRSVLDMSLSDLDIEERKIIVSGEEKYIKLTDHQEAVLRQYIHDTSQYRVGNDILFVTRNGKKTFRSAITQYFEKASRKGGFSFYVTVPMLWRTRIYQLLRDEKLL